MTRFLRIAAAALFAAIAVAACSSNENPPVSSPTTSGGGAGGTTTSSAPTTTSSGGGQTAASVINIENFQFGEPITVKPGAKITVTNKDTAGHNVVSDDGKSFKTAVLQQGQSEQITAPSTAGTYKYSCTLHANMTSTGTLVVEG
jgi:plastocyanin